MTETVPTDLELQKRISLLSDEALAKMLVLDSKDYREDALAIATAEIERRNLTIDALKEILRTALDRPPPRELSDTVKTLGIRGWLLLPAVGMVASPLMILKDMVETWGSQKDVSLLTMVLAFDLALLVYICVTAYVFFLKKRRAPRMVITFLVLSLAFDLVIGVFAATTYDVPFVRCVVGVIGRSLILCAIWIPYFLCSERVRRTFIRE